MEKVLVMTAQITIEFNGGRELNIANGEQWKEASHIFADSLKVFQPGHLTGLEKSGTNLKDFFEGSRPSGFMEAGYDEVKFKLYASRCLEITSNVESSNLMKSLFNSASQELLPIYLAVGIIFQTPNLTVKFAKTGQAAESMEIDLLNCFAKKAN